MNHTHFLFAMCIFATCAVAKEPGELRHAHCAYEAIKHPSEAQRVRYVTRLVRMRESFTRADVEAMKAIDAEVIKYPMPIPSDARMLSKRLVGRWQSPRRPYFYHPDGTWASDEDISTSTGGTWQIKGNTFFQNFRHEEADAGETIILLTSTDFVSSNGIGPGYLRRGKAFPWH